MTSNLCDSKSAIICPQEIVSSSSITINWGLLGKRGGMRSNSDYKEEEFSLKLEYLHLFRQFLEIERELPNFRYYCTSIVFERSSIRITQKLTIVETAFKLS
jgi:hypothetical protein